MGKTRTIRWTTEAASREFGINRGTLSKRIASAGVLPGTDGKYSTVDICSAVFGDIEGEKLRLIREQADTQAIKNATARRELLPKDDVTAHLSAVLVAIRSAILASGQTKEEKADLINNLRRLGESISVKNERSNESIESDMAGDDAAA